MRSIRRTVLVVALALRASISLASPPYTVTVPATGVTVTSDQNRDNLRALSNLFTPVVTSFSFFLPHGTSAPGTCAVGQAWMDTDATTGCRMLLCESADTWVAQCATGGGGGGSGTVTSVTCGTGLTGGAITTSGTCAADFGTASGKIAQGNDSRLSDSRTPTSHATSHKSGGGDSINLDELAAPTDVTTLNATTSAHGLLKKLDNNSAHFMNGQGNWATPAGGGGGAWTPQTSATGTLYAEWYADQGAYTDAGSTLATNNQTVQQWNDQSGNSHNLSQATSGKRPTFKTNQQNGLATFQYDASDDCLTLASVPLGSFTVGMTFYGASGSGVLIEQSAVADSNPGFYIYTGGTPAVEINRGGTKTARDWLTNWGSTYLEWHTIVMQYGASGKFRDLQLWVDGTWQTMAANATYGANDPGAATVTDTLNVGCRNNGAGQVIDGQIGDIVLFSAATSFEDATRLGNYLAKRRDTKGGVGD